MMNKLEFVNGNVIMSIDAAENIRSKGRAAWIRLGNTGGFFEHEWQCSACLSTWIVKGIMTPRGLGYDECPNCHANMVEVVQ